MMGGGGLDVKERIEFDISSKSSGSLYSLV